MAYQDIVYKEKIEVLLEHPSIKTSTKLADLLGVNRNSILRWRDDDEHINVANKENIDFWYCKRIGLEQMNNLSAEAAVLPDNFLYEPDLKDVFARRLSFSSLEIEVEVNEGKFEKVINNEIPQDMNTQAVLEIIGIANATRKMMDAVATDELILDSRQIKNWHYNLMQGIRKDAGEYSKKIRIIPNTEISTTDPDDIKAEIEYWVSKYSGINTIEEIATSHAHFESIHPFGDGNGRVGRLIMSAQCLRANLVPPLVSNYNKAMYYATLEHAQMTGNVKPLTVYLAEQSQKLLSVYANKQPKALLFR